MSNKTRSQVEAIPMNKTEQAKQKLDKLQQKHKQEIGTQAYKQGINNLTTQQLDNAFALITKKLNHGYQ